MYNGCSIHINSELLPSFKVFNFNYTYIINHLFFNLVCDIINLISVLIIKDLFNKLANI